MDLLPSEIISKIADNLSDIRDVKNFSLVNKTNFNNWGVVKRLAFKFDINRPVTRRYTKYKICKNPSKALENITKFFNYVKQQEHMVISEIVFNYFDIICSIKKRIQSDQTFMTSCILNYDNYLCIVTNDMFRNSPFMNITDMTLQCLHSENVLIIQTFQNQLEKLDIQDFKLNLNQFNKFCQMPKLKYLSLHGAIEIYDNSKKNDNVSSTSDSEYDAEDDFKWYSDNGTTLKCEEKYEKYTENDEIVTSPKTQLDWFIYKNMHTYSETQQTSWKVFKQFLPILSKVKTIDLKENRVCGTYLLKDHKVIKLLNNIEHLSIWYIKYPLKMLKPTSYYDYVSKKLPKKIATINIKSLSTLKSFEVSLSINYTHICLSFPKNLYLSHISINFDYIKYGGFKIPIELFCKKMKEVDYYYKFTRKDSENTFEFYRENLYIKDSNCNFTDDNFDCSAYNDWTYELVTDYYTVFCGMTSFTFYFK